MFKYLVLATVLAVSPACKKKEEPAPRPAVTEGSGSAAGSAATGSAAGSATAGSAAAEVPDANADSISVFATHAKPKPDDPVEVKFTKFSVTNAKFDPKNLEGGTATVELDLASLSSGSAKRDGHLSSPDYIDLSKFTTATIDIANVKKKDDQSYAADAKVKFRDIEKTYPVTFQVLETKDDGTVRIGAEQAFTRADFKLGKDTTDETESVAGPLTIKLQLTLKNS